MSRLNEISKRYEDGLVTPADIMWLMTEVAALATQLTKCHTALRDIVSDHCESHAVALGTCPTCTALDILGFAPTTEGDTHV